MVRDAITIRFVRTIFLLSFDFFFRLRFSTARELDSEGRRFYAPLDFRKCFHNSNRFYYAVCLYKYECLCHAVLPDTWF